MEFDELHSLKLCYVRYMGLFSRQLLRDIKFYKVLEFDPCILSSQIDQGPLWSEPKFLEFEMKFPEEDLQQYSKSQPLRNAVEYFWAHESNFQRLLDVYKRGAAVESLSTHESKVYFDEVFVNIPTIYFMLRSYPEVTYSLDKVENICKMIEHPITYGRLRLMQASLELQFLENEAQRFQKTKQAK